MSRLQKNIRVESDQLANIVLDVERGNYRIPQFQRDYVWEVSKVTKLFDSIYREFPIGSFFLWKAGREHNNLFRHMPDLEIRQVRDDDDITYILDGQQRITSLYVTLMGLTRQGTDYSRVCFDLETERFIHRNPDTRRFVSVSQIFGPDSLKLSRQIDEKYLGSFDRCSTVLRRYPVSLVVVQDKGLADVCMIFQRINQGGKRLDRFDLIAAMTFDPEFDLRERVDEDIIHPIADRGFGRIPRGIVTQLIALKVKGACTETAQFGLTRTDIRENWKAVVDAIMLSIDFLKSNCYVLRFEYLPYNPLITLFAYYYLKSGSRSAPRDHMRWMKDFFWRATFGKRFGAGGDTRVAQDSQLIDQLISGRMPEFEVANSIDVEELTRTKMTQTGSAVRCGFLCLLASRHPKHLLNNMEMSMLSGNFSGFTSAEKHHIFPQAFLHREGQAANVHSLPNFCFIPAELNNKISDSMPSEYFAELQRQNPELESTLTTHLIPPVQGSGIDTNDYTTFLRQRARAILAAVENVCGWARRPAKSERHAAIEVAENNLRDFIDYVLTHAHGENCWNEAVHPEVQKYVTRVSKQGMEVGEPALFTKNVREKLNHCTPSHYQLIINGKLNWPHFKPYLQSPREVEQYLKHFADFRNCVAHNKPMDQLLQMNGETALTWLSATIPTMSELRGNADQENVEEEDYDEDLAAKEGVEVKSYDQRALGQTNLERPHHGKWNADTYFHAAQNKLPKDEIEVLRRLLSWSERKADKTSWGRGKKYGSFGPKFPQIGSGALFTAWETGDVSINIANHSKNEEQEKKKQSLALVLNEGRFFVRVFEPPFKYPVVKAHKLVGRVDEFLSIIEKEMGI